MSAEESPCEATQDPDLREILARAQRAGIPASVVDGKLPGQRQGYVLLRFGQGAHQRELMLLPSRLTASKFEQWSFLGPYAAMYHVERNEIEAGLTPPPPSFGLRATMRELIELPGVEVMASPEGNGQSSQGDVDLGSELRGAEGRERHYWRLRLGHPSSTLSLELSPMSDELSTAEGRMGSWREGYSGTSLKIGHVRPQSPDVMLELLEEISASLLFDIDLVYGHVLELMRSRRTRRPVGRFGYRPRSSSASPPRFPTVQYSKEAALLYSYGRASTGIPLLEYLAYYQVLEYFFPMYTQAESIRMLRAAIQDPRFDVMNDGAVAAVLRQVSPGGRGISEREQLQDTLRVCVSESEVLEFIRDDPERESFLGRSAIQGLRNIQPKDGNFPLINQVAARIYGLRCRIVHSKDEGRTADSLLPFSEDARRLGHDLDLIRYLAQRVIIYSADRPHWMDRRTK